MSIETTGDHDENQLLLIAKAFELLGHRPSPATVWRWKKRGCKGIPLPYTQLGGRSMISLIKAREWLENVKVATAKHSLVPLNSIKLTARQRSAAIQLAKLVGKQRS